MQQSGVGTYRPRSSTRYLLARPVTAEPTSTDAADRRSVPTRPKRFDQTSVDNAPRRPPNVKTATIRPNCVDCQVIRRTLSIRDCEGLTVKGIQLLNHLSPVLPVECPGQVTASCIPLKAEIPKPYCKVCNAAHAVCRATDRVEGIFVMFMYSRGKNS